MCFWDPDFNTCPGITFPELVTAHFPLFSRVYQQPGPGSFVPIYLCLSGRVTPCVFHTQLLLFRCHLFVLIVCFIVGSSLFSALSCLVSCMYKPIAWMLFPHDKFLVISQTDPAWLADLWAPAPASPLACCLHPLPLCSHSYTVATSTVHSISYLMANWERTKCHFRWVPETIRERTVFMSTFMSLFFKL